MIQRSDFAVYVLCEFAWYGIFRDNLPGAVDYSVLQLYRLEYQNCTWQTSASGRWAPRDSLAVGCE